MGRRVDACGRAIISQPRQPVFFDVLLDGQPAGRLEKTTAAEREVQLEMYSPSGQKPKSAVEEVVVEVSGTIRLAGRPAPGPPGPSQRDRRPVESCAARDGQSGRRRRGAEDPGRAGGREEAERRRSQANPARNKRPKRSGKTTNSRNSAQQEAEKKRQENQTKKKQTGGGK